MFSADRYAVDDTGVTVIPADPDGGGAIITNQGTSEVYLHEDPDFDPSTDGYELAANATLSILVGSDDGPLTAKCATGETATVHVLRTRA